MVPTAVHGAALRRLSSISFLLSPIPCKELRTPRFGYLVQGTTKLFSNTMWRTHLGKFDDNVMSAEEQTIRAELETDIETNLEEELKDDICRLTVSLHRLYLHKKDMNDKLTSSNDNSTEVTTVVKITTKTVGEYMMQIYESKTSALDVVRHCSSRSKATQGSVYGGNKQTEWAKTLLSTRGSTVAAGKKHGSFDRYGSGKSPNVRHLKKEGRSSCGESSQTSKPNERNKKKLLELGWKY